MPNTETNVTIDLGVVAERYNENNPHKKKMTQKELVKQVGITNDTCTKWKKKAPVAVEVVLKLMEIGNCDITDFVKVEPKNKN